MTITIDDNRRILDIQEEFNRQFPYLKIEFYSTTKLRDGSLVYKINSLNTPIGDCRTIHNKGNISIDPSMTVTELEKQFKEFYGLNVRLYRKSLNVWLDTSVTDAWTLREQNAQGEALSKLSA